MSKFMDAMREAKIKELTERFGFEVNIPEDDGNFYHPEFKVGKVVYTGQAEWDADNEIPYGLRPSGFGDYRYPAFNIEVISTIYRRGDLVKLEVLYDELSITMKKISEFLYLDDD